MACSSSSRPARPGGLAALQGGLPGRAAREGAPSQLMRPAQPERARSAEHPAASAGRHRTHAPRPALLQLRSTSYSTSSALFSAVSLRRGAAAVAQDAGPGRRAPSSRSVLRLRSCASSSTSALYCRSRKSACAAARPAASGPVVRVLGLEGGRVRRARGERRPRRARWPPPRCSRQALAAAWPCHASDRHEPPPRQAAAVTGAFPWEVAGGGTGGPPL